MDIAIVIETSEKTKDDKKIKEIATKIVESYPVSPDKARVTVVQYGDRPEVIDDIDTYTPKEKLIPKINERPPMGGKPSLDKALELVNKTIIEGHPRKYVPKVIFIVKTDAPPTPEEKKNVPGIAKKIRDENIGIVTVTVGENAEKPENKEFLKKIVTKPKYIISLKTPEEMMEDPTRLNKIIQEACIKREYNMSFLNSF